MGYQLTRLLMGRFPPRCRTIPLQHVIPYEQVSDVKWIFVMEVQYQLVHRNRTSGPGCVSYQVCCIIKELVWVTIWALFLIPNFLEQFQIFRFPSFKHISHEGTGTVFVFKDSPFVCYVAHLVYYNSGVPVHPDLAKADIYLINIIQMNAGRRPISSTLSCSMRGHWIDRLAVVFPNIRQAFPRANVVRNVSIWEWDCF